MRARINFRYVRDENKRIKETMCSIVSEHNLPIGLGIARVNPAEQANKAVGRDLSLKRAYRSLVSNRNVDREKRRLVWECLSSAYDQRARWFDLHV